jgi:hypothetical protein
MLFDDYVFLLNCCKDFLRKKSLRACKLYKNTSFWAKLGAVLLLLYLFKRCMWGRLVDYLNRLCIPDLYVKGADGVHRSANLLGWGNTGYILTLILVYVVVCLYLYWCKQKLQGFIPYSAREEIYAESRYARRLKLFVGVVGWCRRVFNHPTFQLFLILVCMDCHLVANLLG